MFVALHLIYDAQCPSRWELTEVYSKESKIAVRFWGECLRLTQVADIGRTELRKDTKRDSNLNKY